jgi:hypothetical protein
VAVPLKEGGLENGAEPAAAKGRWYRTRWGITAIVIIIIIIVGGIVGGVVGGTHHSSSKKTAGGGNNTGIPESNSSTSTGDGGLTGQPNPSTTGVIGVTGGPGPSTRSSDPFRPSSTGANVAPNSIAADQPSTQSGQPLH